MTEVVVLRKIGAIVLTSVFSIGILSSFIGFILHMTGVDVCGTMVFVSLGVVFGFALGQFTQPRDLTVFAGGKLDAFIELQLEEDMDEIEDQKKQQID